MEKRKPELEFMTEAPEILSILNHSKEFGNVIGICSPALGPGIFITTVDNIVEDYETIVYLKPYDVNGYKLEKSTLKLTEIVSACAFRSHYKKLYHDQPKANKHLEGVYY
jgi:hypothetical protein